jgi:quercetin dioxygenase-like cupin family protein
MSEAVRRRCEPQEAKGTGMTSSSPNFTPSTDSRPEKWLSMRPGERCLIRVAAADTGGAFSIVEIVSAPGDGTPLHEHSKEDEHILILEGRARINYGSKVLDAGPGETVSLIRAVPHAWRTVSDTPLRMLVTGTPGGVEDVIRILASEDEVDMPALVARFGVRNLGPMPTD